MKTTFTYRVAKKHLAPRSRPAWEWIARLNREVARSRVLPTGSALLIEAQSGEGVWVTPGTAVVVPKTTRGCGRGVVGVGVDVRRLGKVGNWAWLPDLGAKPADVLLPGGGDPRTLVVWLHKQPLTVEAWAGVGARIYRADTPERVLERQGEGVREARARRRVLRHLAHLPRVGEAPWTDTVEPWVAMATGRLWRARPR